MVRAFAHGATGHWIDPTWWTHWTISRSCQCPTTGVTRNEMFYLRTHSTHFIYGYMASHIWRHSDSERGYLLPPHGLLFPINSKGSFIYAPSHRQDNIYHSLCYTSRGALAGTRISSMGPNHEGPIK